MKKIAVLGLGAMGSRIALRLLKAGHEVTVWNRTEAAIQAITGAGAIAAPTPKRAAANADFVISMVRDDEASRALWLDAENGALAGMSENALAIESSTLTQQWILELGRHAAERGVGLLEAPVSGSRAAAETGQLIYLVGGDASLLERARPLLQDASLAIHHVGDLGKGALTKLATNALLGVQVTALAEIIGMLRYNGADVQTVLRAIAGTSVWAPVANYLAGSMVSENFAPQFTIDLIEKDFGYTVASTQSAPTIEAARGVFQKAIAQGLEQQNMTGVVSLFKPHKAS